MHKFIFLTFVFLAWALYEMSGGSDFEPSQPVAAADPQPAPQVEAAPRKLARAQTPEPAAVPAVEVTRAAYTAPSYDLRAPAREELAAVDPAVLASFAGVLKSGKDSATPTPAVTVSAEDGLTAGTLVPDLREVTGNRVNMRNGPGTTYSVVDRLERGDAVQVLAEPGNGWVKLRVEDSGRIGWMADFLVSAAN